MRSADYEVIRTLLYIVSILFSLVWANCIVDRQRFLKLVLVSLLLRHAQRPLFAYIYANLAIRTLLCVDYRMFIVLFTLQSYALYRTLLYTSPTAIALLQIYYCWHFFSYHSPNLFFSLLSFW